MSVSYEKWYALAVVSGRERKISREINNKLDRGGYKGIDIVCPDEEVILDKGTENRRVVRRLTLPGYLLIHGRGINNAALSTIRNVTGVLGFLGGDDNEPNPLPRGDIEKILGLESQGGPVREAAFSVGDHVRITDGPMTDFEGLVSAVNESQDTAVVELEIFGRTTPTTVSFRHMQRSS